MHIGAILLITLIILVCLGPGAILRALAGLGCLIVLGAVFLLLLWWVSRLQESATRSSAGTSQLDLGTEQREIATDWLVVVPCA